jgi:Glycosyl hydrolases family 2, sugar binding domain/Glycosyl hydrolases family 2, TIM barrel domain/Glycosyl hydrolases family 2
MKKQLFIFLFLIYSSSQFARQPNTGKLGNEQRGSLSGKYSTEGNLSFPASSSETTLISLDGRWQFKQGEYIKGEQLADSVMLPGSMDTNRKGDPKQVSTENIKELTRHLARYYTYSGKAVYEKTVDIPTNWSGKSVRLLLERTRETKVWVNDKYAGWQNALGIAQIYDISDLIIPGRENLIVIEVDNSKYSAGNRITGSHMATEETSTNWNGIVGRIQLIAEDYIYIKSINAYPIITEKTARIKLVIGSSIYAKGTITLNASSWNDKAIDKTKEMRLKFSTKGSDAFLEFDYYMGDKVKLWSEFSPVMYRLKMDLTAENGQFNDSKTIDFGMREFKVDSKGKQFTINGITTFLRGEVNCNIFPVTGYCPMDKNSWKEFLGKFKSFGVNHMRFHTWCPPEAAFEAADELGLYMQPELYFFGGRPDPFSSYDLYAYAKEEGERLLKAYANHPSFVMLAFGNEQEATEGRKIDLYNYFKSLDNSRLYTEGSNTFYWDHKAGDNFKGDYRTSAATNLGICREQSYFETHSPSSTLNFDDKIAELKKPFISHETGQFQTFPDYNEIAKYKNTIFRPANLEYFRDLLITKNMMDQNQDFQKASGQWTVILYREEIEAALRSSHFAGYQLLSFQDFPGQATALVGLYDSFMDTKNIIKAEEIKRFNSDIVLLAEMEKYIWTSDESYSAKIKIANYSPKLLLGVIPFWLIKNENGVKLASGNLSRIDISQGGLTTLGEINVPLKMIASSQKLTLEIGITDSLYRNSYFIWVYPAKINTSVPSGIHVTTILDQVAKNVLDLGGKVLLLPKPDNMNPARSISPKFMIDFWSPMFHNYTKNDSYTLGLLINPYHPALKGFPTDFHSNWQWYDLVKNSRSVILDNTSSSYKPIVQTIDHFDRDLKLGNIFEAAVSRGKLLVCTFDLLGLMASRPEARQLYSSILTYMSSDAFQPSETLSEQFFDDLIGNSR